MIVSFWYCYCFDSIKNTLDIDFNELTQSENIDIVDRAFDTEPFIAVSWKLIERRQMSLIIFWQD